MEIKQACDRSAIFAKIKNEVSISFKIKWQEGEVREREILEFVGWVCVVLVQLENWGMVEDLAGGIAFPELHQFCWTQQTAYMGFYYHKTWVVVR